MHSRINDTLIRKIELHARNILNQLT